MAPPQPVIGRRKRQRQQAQKSGADRPDAPLKASASTPALLASASNVASPPPPQPVAEAATAADPAAEPAAASAYNSRVSTDVNRVSEAVRRMRLKPALAKPRWDEPMPVPYTDTRPTVVAKLRIASKVAAVLRDAKETAEAATTEAKRLGLRVPRQIAWRQKQAIAAAESGADPNDQDAQPLQAVAWGWGGEGRLGAGDGNGRAAPTPVAQARTFSDKYVDVVAGARHSLLVTTFGNVFAFGDGEAGQLGSSRAAPLFHAVTTKEQRVKNKADAAVAAAQAERDAEANVKAATRKALGARARVKFDAEEARVAKEEERTKARKEAGKKKKKRGKPASVATLLHKGEKPCPKGRSWGGKDVRHVLAGEDVPTRHMLRLPRPVFPSGHVQRGGDFPIAQLGAGAGASYARAASIEDGVAACDGLADMLARVVALEARLGGDNAVVARLRAHLIEERATLGRRYPGTVLAWGSGKQGQLGLGYNRPAARVPTTLSGLAEERIAKIACGRQHVLALTVAGKVWAWGSGRDGRLGMDDYAHRHTPALIEALRYETVTVIAAGDAHSLAAGPPAADAAAGADADGDGVPDVAASSPVWTWGRGAHGRLGTGRNMNRRKPVRVDVWPSSYVGCAVTAAALGGAHTIVLAQRRIQPGLVNPWGVETRLYAWGYGTNGQLGTDVVENEFRPRKVRMPKWELTTAVAAGRSHSIALTVYGELYAWGRGYWGELGTGAEGFAIAPRKVPMPQMVLKVSAGDRHSVALCTKRTLSRREIERKPASVPNAYAGLPRFESETLGNGWCSGLSCLNPRAKRTALYDCLTCGLCVGEDCATRCHRGHDLVVSRRPRRILCECSTSETCRRLPAVGEELGAAEVAAAALLQRTVRKLLGRLFFAKVIRQLATARRMAASRVWASKVTGPIFGRVNEHRAVKLQEYERNTMTSADSESRAARQYLKLQLCLQAIDIQKAALRTIVGRVGVADPHPSAAGASERFLTRQALREHQRRHPYIERLGEQALVRYTAGLPACAVGTELTAARLVADPDVCELARSVEEQSPCLTHVHPTGEEDADGREVLEYAPRPPKRRHSLCAPPGLYERVTTLRPQLQRRVLVRRRNSFDAGCRVDKHSGIVDRDATVRSKISAAGARLSRNLAKKILLPTSLAVPKAAVAKSLAVSKFEAMLVAFEPRAPAPDIAPAAAAEETRDGRRRRRFSIAAPERAGGSLALWLRHQGLVRKQQRAPDPEWEGPRTARAWRPEAEMRTLERTDWEDESRVVEVIAERNGKVIDLGGSSSDEDSAAGSGGDSDDSDDGEDGEDGDAVADVGKAAEAAVEAPLPVDDGTPQWLPTQDEEGNTYYYHTLTGETAWENPDAIMDTAVGMTVGGEVGQSGYHAAAETQDGGGGGGAWDTGYYDEG